MMTTDTLAEQTVSLLAGFGIPSEMLNAGDFPVVSPIDGGRIASLRRHTRGDLDGMIAAAERAFVLWRAVPPPRPGAPVPLFSGPFRQPKPPARRPWAVASAEVL